MQPGRPRRRATLIVRYRPRFNSKQREALWAAECWRAAIAGRGSLPICNLCDQVVRETDAWDESHDPGRAKAFGGRATGVAHHRCNHEHGAKVVTPAVAKAKRVHAKHIGAAGPGLGRTPMRGGRRDGIRRTMRNGVRPRLTGAERHAATIAKLALTAPDGSKVGLWAPDVPHVEE